VFLSILSMLVSGMSTNMSLIPEIKESDNHEVPLIKKAPHTWYGAFVIY
jgi:hypothetical protein